MTNQISQQQFAEAVGAELDKMFMDWDKDLKEWHLIALKALRHGSAVNVQVKDNKFIDLLKTTPEGINLNVVAILANNLSARTPAELNMNLDEYSSALLLNSKIAFRWNALVMPVQEAVKKRFQIMGNKPAFSIERGKA